MDETREFRSIILLFLPPALKKEAIELVCIHYGERETLMRCCLVNKGLLIKHCHCCAEMNYSLLSNWRSQGGEWRELTLELWAPLVPDLPVPYHYHRISLSIHLIGPLLLLIIVFHLITCMVPACCRT